MSRDKQIEEMVKDICKIEKPCKECSAYQDACKAVRYAERFYHAGYRKASDVAREIFEEIERLMFAYRFFTLEGVYYHKDLKDALADLKKKYESEGEG